MPVASLPCAAADITGASADSNEIKGSPPTTIKDSALLASELSHDTRMRQQAGCAESKGSRQSSRQPDK